MSIRIRNVGGVLVALCAARSIEKPGDVYLDDAQHHALAEKFSEDFASEGVCSRAIDPKDAEIRAAEESNNEAREWWDRTYGVSANNQPVIYDDGPMHGWFGLSYASYLVLRRSFIQAMPSGWQQRLVDLLGEMRARLDIDDIPSDFRVTLVDDANRFAVDPWRDYRRGPEPPRRAV